MHSEEVKEELKTLSVKHSVTIEQLREIIYLVFKYIRNVIKSASKEALYFPAIRLMGIGIFHVTIAKQNKYKEKINNDKNNNIGPEKFKESY